MLSKGSSSYTFSWEPAHSRLALAAAAALLVLVSATWAFAVRPAPFSDWAYYWDAALGVVGYERGGILLFILRMLQAIDLRPFAAALVMNMAAALAIMAITYRAEGSRVGVATILVTAYLFAITPFHSVVQFDLPATALLFGGIYLLAIRSYPGAKGWPTVAGVTLVALAVSSRPQFLLILLCFSTILVLGVVIPGRLAGRQATPATTLAVALAAAALLGFAMDSALRAQADRSEAVRTNSAVTLYAGLLSSGVSPPACGHWSRRATRDARADARLPVLEAVAGRLQEKPLEHWLSVLACKIPGILLPSPYSLSWSLGAPNVVERLDDPGQLQQLTRWAPQLYRLEFWVYRGLLVLIYGYVGLVVVLRARKRQWAAAALPVFWLVSYWAVHSVFEIQARYFLSLFLVMPLLATGAPARMFDHSRQD